MTVPILSLAHATKYRGVAPTLINITLKVDPGEVVVIVGPSGAGKTTLIRSMSFLERLDKGTITLDDISIDLHTDQKVVTHLQNRIGVVFQDYHLWPHKTALENITEALREVKQLSKSDAVQKARDWLDKVDLLDKRDAYPDTLSGGQKQRVAIARTLAMNPEIVLFDEITAALDPELVAGVLKIIKRLAKDGITMVVVTHHMRFAREIADRIIFLDQGRVVEEGEPEKFFDHPAQSRTKEFLGSVLDTKQSINVYEGYEDFQAYHLGLLKRVPSASVGYVVGAAGDRWFECMGSAYQEYETLLKKKHLTWKWVSFKIEDAEKKAQQHLGTQLQISLIPKEYATPSNFNLWNDTIVLQTFGEIPAIIEIRNKALVDGYLNYFKLLWDLGKKQVP